MIIDTGTVKRLTRASRIIVLDTTKDGHGVLPGRGDGPGRKWGRQNGRQQEEALMKLKSHKSLWFRAEFSDARIPLAM
jgi:hypothetical protein